MEPLADERVDDAAEFGGIGTRRDAERDAARERELEGVVRGAIRRVRRLVARRELDEGRPGARCLSKPRLTPPGVERPRAEADGRRESCGGESAAVPAVQDAEAVGGDHAVSVIGNADRASESVVESGRALTMNPAPGDCPRHVVKPSPPSPSHRRRKDHRRCEGRRWAMERSTVATSAPEPELSRPKTSLPYPRAHTKPGRPTKGY